MRDELISMYIDDELDLDDKREFVELIHHDRTFKDRTMEFLDLEKELRSEVVEEAPEVVMATTGVLPLVRRRRLQIAAAAVAAVAAIVAVFVLRPESPRVDGKVAQGSYRFVIYQPDISRAEIMGDFTGWKRVPMERVSMSGYWETSLPVEPGEHRYVFVLDGEKRIADPTVISREKDDFGSENSILVVRVGT
ncbi:MAG TPA: glycogen-binding domain-containing protein [Deltaproteobacteria bacterium]|nr:glycogen-binding domain-containing protein [Deltaproteobacteria bacterium]HOM28373.1 glycogen-binding domain-containing protein [Deltaproteobacteria bacterium]HPP81692.1 glycogen-binding domain-containing protein [Deltaproteobacteria bacterium]